MIPGRRLVPAVFGTDKFPAYCRFATLAQCVLVKGWKSSSGWGFPKGKINEDESPPNCAIREVLEETGYNLAGQINPEHVIEMTIKEQKISLYIVSGIPEDYPFKTKTRKEISKIEWFKLTELPTWKRNKGAPGKFYLISPFIGLLKAFIKQHKPRNSPNKSPARARKAQNGLSSKQEPYLTETDPGQESSSQTSSGDNPDPQTPSPQHTQSFVSSIPTPSGGSALDFGHPIDPHFARLLSSLTKSAPEAGHAVNDGTLTSTPAHQLQHNNGLINDTRVGTKPPSRHSYQHDGVRNMSDPINAKQAIPSQPQTAQLPPLSLDLVSRTAELSPSAFAASPASGKTPVSPSTSTTSPKASRRTASTADISPYLSRPTELPTSAKRLKQLALLESVADESARMTPLLTHREASFASSSMNDRPPTLPAMPRNNPGDSGVLYSSRIPLSGSNVGPPPASPFVSATQARAQTSLGYRNPIHHSGSVSMNQSQLLSLMNGRTTTPHGQTYNQSHSGYQLTPQPPFYSPTGVSSQHAATMHHPPPPLHNPFNLAPSTFPQGHQPPIRPNPQANSLLSILSGNRSLSGGTHGTLLPNGHL
ncbi:hypothetical protein AX16_009629 [Volvariella volvacea WC 439]|nr:hypothetical protein AX16_009629 [Volvariella volvacea WC 439]